MLWLWTTNYHMLNGSRHSRRLGIPARYDCILATRGNKQTTLLEGPVRGHSVKPVEFYELVETALSGAALRLFVLAVPAQSAMGLPWR
jgi:N6-adenosine-specific RNA methylase IME4